jgi:hypothetical protein
MAAVGHGALALEVAVGAGLAAVVLGALAGGDGVGQLGPQGVGLAGVLGLRGAQPVELAARLLQRGGRPVLLGLSLLPHHADHRARDHLVVDVARRFAVALGGGAPRA